MILIITYIIFIIWLSLTIKNKTKNLYNANLSKDVHMYMYIWIFILIVLGIVKIIQYNNNIWILGLILVVLKQYIILVLRIILFRIYFETKKIYNYNVVFNCQYFFYKIFGITFLIKYTKFKLFLIKSLKLILPIMLCFNTNTVLILALILMLMDLKGHIFNRVMDDACINVHHGNQIILNEYGRYKIMVYQNNLMNVKIIDYAKTGLAVLANQDFKFVDKWLNQE